jgi:hypothetical protein
MFSIESELRDLSERQQAVENLLADVVGRRNADDAVQSDLRRRVEDVQHRTIQLEKRVESIAKELKGGSPRRMR